MARAHVDPEKEQALAALEQVYAPGLDAPRSAVSQCLRRQEPVLLPEVDPAAVRAGAA